VRWAWITAVIALVGLAATGAGAMAPQDDAGSGQDAPDYPSSEVEIEAGEIYQGLLEGVASDSSDHYAFEAEAGDRIEALADGLVGCLFLKGPDGTAISFTCTVRESQLTRVTGTASLDGTHYLEYAYLHPQPSRFRLGVNDPAPPPVPTSGFLRGIGAGIADVSPADETDEHTVIAVVDTGINLYHRFFSAPQLDTHASQWLDGFPDDVEAVELSLGADSYADAVDQDEDRLRAVERSTHVLDGTQDTHVYTFPGTRVVGGISFGEYGSALGEAGEIPILDESGHGTGSAALAAGASLAGADGNVLIVAVEITSGSFDEGIGWAVDQPWIDAVSVSLGTAANVPLGGDTVPDIMQKAGERGKPVFVASGNGFTNSGVTPDHCTTYTSPYTGPPAVTRIGAAEPRSQNPSWWHCVPVDAIARTPMPSADHTSMTDLGLHSGTSAATPNAIGHWAELHQRAQAHDLDVNRTEVTEHLLHAARPANPQPRPLAEPSTPFTAPADQGYGVVDQDALEAAWDRLSADQAPAERPLAESFFEIDDQIRERLWGEEGVMAGGAGLDAVRDLLNGASQAVQAQDDAGSGQDAPDDRSTEIVVQPGPIYEGILGPPAFDDLQDWYAFEAESGDEISARLASQLVCLDIVDPDGDIRASSGCARPGLSKTATVPADETGTWYLHLIHLPFKPSPYRFSLGLDGTAPDTGPTAFGPAR
jgi:hypothetical protein